MSAKKEGWFRQKQCQKGHSFPRDEAVFGRFFNLEKGGECLRRACRGKIAENKSVWQVAPRDSLAPLSSERATPCHRIAAVRVRVSGGPTGMRMMGGRDLSSSSKPRGDGNLIRQMASYWGDSAVPTKISPAFAAAFHFSSARRRGAPSRSYCDWTFTSRVWL